MAESTDFNSESTQSVFERAVRHHLPSAFITLLERVDEFSVGKVLVLHKKPHFWSSRELDFTSLPLSALISEAQGGGKALSIQTESKKLFDQTSDASNRMIKLDLALDAELKTAWGSLGGDIGGGGTKFVHLLVDFGSVHHIVSDLYQTLSSQQWTVNTGHEVVKDALDKGKEMYVITSVYQADKTIVRIGEALKINVDNDDNGSKGKDAGGGSGGDGNHGDGDEKQASKSSNGGGGGMKPSESGKGDEDITGDTSGIEVTSRTSPTIIAFQVMKLTIDKNGVITPHAKTGLKHHHHVHDSYGDSFVSIHHDEGQKGEAPSTKDKGGES